MNTDFFYIDIDILKGYELFPFHLYVYADKTDQYELFLNANDPLTLEKLSFLIFITNNNGKLAIATKQKLTYLNFFGLKDIESGDNLHYLEKERLVNLEKLKKQVDSNIDYEQQLFNAFQSDDFSKLIKRTKLELSTLPFNISMEVSIVNKLSELLEEDIMSNRVITTCYYICKILNINIDQGSIDLILASFVYHLGEMHLPQKLVDANLKELSEENLKNYKRHINLTFNILKKLDFKLNETTKEIIEQHHELTTYSGYPKGLGREQINPLSLILGGVSLIFESAKGRYFENSGNLMKDIEFLFHNTDKTLIPASFGNDLKKIFFKLLEETRQAS